MPSITRAIEVEIEYSVGGWSIRRLPVHVQYLLDMNSCYDKAARIVNMYYNIFQQDIHSLLSRGSPNKQPAYRLTEFTNTNSYLCLLYKNGINYYFNFSSQCLSHMYIPPVHYFFKNCKHEVC